MIGLPETPNFPQKAISMLKETEIIELIREAMRYSEKHEKQQVVQGIFCIDSGYGSSLNIRDNLSQQMFEICVKQENNSYETLIEKAIKELEQKEKDWNFEKIRKSLLNNDFLPLIYHIAGYLLSTIKKEASWHLLESLESYCPSNTLELFEAKIPGFYVFKESKDVYRFHVIGFGNDKSFEILNNKDFWSLKHFVVKSFLSEGKVSQESYFLEIEKENKHEESHQKSDELFRKVRQLQCLILPAIFKAVCDNPDMDIEEIFNQISKVEQLSKEEIEKYRLQAEKMYL